MEPAPRRKVESGQREHSCQLSIHSCMTPWENAKLYFHERACCVTTWFICFHKFLYHFPLMKLNSLSVSDGVFPSTHKPVATTLQRLLNSLALWMEFQSYQSWQAYLLTCWGHFTHSLALRENPTFFMSLLIVLDSFRKLFSMFWLYCTQIPIILVSQ